jgi:serine/threonine protein kinase
VLEESCSQDPELRGEVESLPVAREDAGDFLSPQDLSTHIADLNSANPLGNRLGHYEIIGVIGAGGMGEVYRARDTRLDRAVALKVLPPDFTDTSTRVTRFQLEAKAAATREVAEVVRLENEPHWSFLGLALSPDGRYLLNVQIDREANDLIMVENFR